MKKFALLLYLILFVAGSSYSETITQTLRGQVTDRQTLQPLPGANIIIPGSDPLMGTTSDINGNFILPEVPVGRVDIRVTFMGYREVFLSSINHISGKETVLHIEMEEYAITGQEVVVTADRNKAESINPMSTVSARGFTVEETERFAGSRNDVARMASSYAGVVGNSDDRNDIIVRGNSPTGLLWRLEGIDIPSPNHWAAFGTSGGPVSMLNNTLLANSDFMSGAFPAEYGNATASVFDLRMRNGNNQNHEFLGQVGFNGFELGAEGPLASQYNGSYLINLCYSTMEVFDMIGMNFGTVGVPQYKDMSFKINLPQTPVGSFSLFGLGGLSKIEMLDRFRDNEEVDYYAGEGFDLINSADMGVMGINHIARLNPDAFFRSTLALSHRNVRTDVDSLVLPQMNPFRIYGNRFEENRISGNFSLNARLNSQNRTKAGIMVSNRMMSLADSAYSYRFEQIIKLTDMNGSAWLLQPYAQWQHHLSNNMTLNAGIHYQHFLLNNSSSLEPRLGARYNFLPNQAISAGYGRHSQILPENIYSREVFDGNTYHQPNKELGMIKSDHFVLGYDYSLNPHTRIKMETYFQRLFNVPIDGNRQNSYSMLNQGANFGVWSPDTLVSEGTGQNMGVELTIERFFHQGLYYLLTASVFESGYRASDNQWRSTAFNNNYIANALAGYEFNVGKGGRNTLNINMKATWAGGQRYIPNRTVWDEDNQLWDRQLIHSQAFSEQYRDYFRIDLSIGFRMNTGEITQEWGLEVTNLLNNQNIFNTRFNAQTGEESFTYQLPMMIIPQWRIRF